MMRKAGARPDGPALKTGRRRRREGSACRVSASAWPCARSKKPPAGFPRGWSILWKTIANYLLKYPPPVGPDSVMRLAWFRRSWTPEHRRSKGMPQRPPMTSVAEKWAGVAIPGPVGSRAIRGRKACYGSQCIGRHLREHCGRRPAEGTPDASRKPARENSVPSRSRTGWQWLRMSGNSPKSVRAFSPPRLPA